MITYVGLFTIMVNVSKNQVKESKRLHTNMWLGNAASEEIAPLLLFVDWPGKPRYDREHFPNIGFRLGYYTYFLKYLPKHNIFPKKLQSKNLIKVLREAMKIVYYIGLSPEGNFVLSKTLSQSLVCLIFGSSYLW